MTVIGCKGRRLPRGAARITAVAVALAASGLAVTGASPAVGQQVIQPQLEYTCSYPSSLREPPLNMGVLVRATFPQADTVGQPIQPTGTGLTITVPHAEIASLTGAGATAVAASARLSVKVAQNGAAAGGSWPGVSKPIPVPAKGSLVLDTAGTVPPVTVRAAGNVTFTAASLSVLITSGTAAAGATVRPLSCQLQPGQNPTLATVPVAAAAGSSSPGRQGVPGHGAAISVGSAKSAAPPSCPPFPKNGFQFNPRFPLPPYPKGSNVIFPKPEFQGCAYIVGFSDVSKLHGAALVGPGLSNININRRVVLNLKRKYAQIDSAGVLSYQPCPTCKPENALPPATNTLLSFGFMPTTVTLQIIQIGTLNIASVGSSLGPLKYSRVWSLAYIHVLKVAVNGTPLNVGNNCQTSPFDLVLTGRPPYSLQLGGVLTGTVTVPPFSGCGVYENLDRIFTASVSGPGNFVKITQGSLCTPNSGVGCPPTIPKPVH